MNKICNECKKEFPAESFDKRADGEPIAYCTFCKKQYNKNYYEARKQNSKNKIDEMKKALKKAKQCESCKDCHIVYPHFILCFSIASDQELLESSDIESLKAKIKNSDILCLHCNQYRKNPD